MIELHVKPYCHNCPGFEPELEVVKLTTQNGWSPLPSYKVTTFVRCKYRGRCESIFEHMKKEEAKKVNENG